MPLQGSLEMHWPRCQSFQVPLRQPHCFSAARLPPAPSSSPEDVSRAGCTCHAKCCQVHLVSLRAHVELVLPLPPILRYAKYTVPQAGQFRPSWHEKSLLHAEGLQPAL